MRSVFLDTDVILDIVTKREPYFDISVQLMDLAMQDKIKLIIAECGLANLFYFCHDVYKIEKASTVLVNFFATCKIVHGGKDMALNALNSAFKDKEDALQYFSALSTDAEYFITQNTADYKHAVKSLPVYTPEQFIKLVASLNL